MNNIASQRKDKDINEILKSLRYSYGEAGELYFFASNTRGLCQRLIEIQNTINDLYRAKRDNNYTSVFCINSFHTIVIKAVRLYNKQIDSSKIFNNNVIERTKIMFAASFEKEYEYNQLKSQ